METRNFHLINHNFDNLSVNRGCDIERIRLENGDWLEKKFVIATGQLIAERLTEFGSDDDGDRVITETIIHFSWEREENGNTVISKEHKITAPTTFGVDGHGRRKIRTVVL